MIVLTDNRCTDAVTGGVQVQDLVSDAVVRVISRRDYKRQSALATALLPVSGVLRLHPNQGRLVGERLLGCEELRSDQRSQPRTAFAQKSRTDRPQPRTDLLIFS